MNSASQLTKLLIGEKWHKFIDTLGNTTLFNKGRDGYQASRKLAKFDSWNRRATAHVFKNIEL